MMTPEVFRLAMIALFTDHPEDEEYDPETAHAAADVVMCKLLRELDYEEGIEIFERGRRFYS